METLSLTKEEKTELQELLGYLNRLDVAAIQCISKQRLMDYAILDGERDNVKDKIINLVRAIAIGQADFL